jgi:hypothetical protein
MLSPFTWAMVDVYSLVSGVAVAVMPGMSDAVAWGVGVVAWVGSWVVPVHALSTASTARAPTAALSLRSRMERMYQHLLGGAHHC